MILEHAFQGVGMFSALFSFLGGGLFRSIWGEVSAYITKRQDHAHELEAMRLQAELDDKTHAREMDRLKLASELKVSEVRVQGEVETQLTDAATFAKGLEVFNQKSGVQWIDGWNGAVRPAFATACLVIWGWSIGARGFILTPFDYDLVAGIVGFFFADRTLGKRSK